MFDKVTMKFDGRFYEWPVSELDMPADAATDSHVLAAVQTKLGVESLSGYVVDPPQSERLAGQHDDKTVLNVRPTATYGIEYQPLRS